MLRRDHLSIIAGGRDQGASSQMIGLSEDASGALMYGGDGGVLENVSFDAGELEVML